MKYQRKLRHQEGVSIVEWLVAMAILLMLLTGVVPLFYRATITNMASQETTQVIAFAQSATEEVFDLAFNDPELTVGAGNVSTTVSRLDPWLPDPSHPSRMRMDPFRGEWIPYDSGTHGPDDNEYERSVTVRQYNIDAIDDGVITDDEALAAGSDPRLVHFKRVSVRIDGGMNTTAGVSRQNIDLEMMKAN